MQRNVIGFFLFFSLFLSFSVFQGCKKRGEAVSVEPVNDSVPAMGFWPDSLDLMEETVRSGETFTGIMTRLGMTKEDAFLLSQNIDTVFDVTKMKAGNVVEAYFKVDTTGTAGDESSFGLQYVVYEEDNITSVIFKATPPFSAWKYTKPVETFVKYTDVTISTSLWNDLVNAGAPTEMIARLSDIYAWSVDFFSLQDGDRFRALYEEKVCGDKVMAVDTVYYAEFQRDSTIIPAVMLKNEEGRCAYWKADGESLRKAFLKAPLKFTRISSGFSYHRKHPVTGKVKPHTAVDYAAPTGTPIMSIGDGTVLSAGYSGGGGNTVKIRHNSTYTTSYMHLSRYAKGIRAGAKVRQGDVIGYVGMTGTATGPHLDFRVYKNGTPINPLHMESPAADPLPKKYLPALDSAYRFYSKTMKSLSAVPGTKEPIDSIYAK